MDKPSFSPKFWQALATDNPLGRNDISAHDAQAWFDLIWPAYRERHTHVRKPKHKLRVSQWWLNLKPYDLDRARDRSDNLRRSASSAKFASLAAQKAPPPRTDLPPLTISRGGRHD